MMAELVAFSSSDTNNPTDPVRAAGQISRQRERRHRGGYSPRRNYLESFEYSSAVDILGTGKFHVYLALVCGLMYLAAGLQNNLNAYILPSVHCDLHISSAQMGMLNAVFLAGGITSNLPWGIIADMYGRKKVVVYGMFIDGILTLCSSLSQHFYVLLIFRFLNGIVIGGPASVIFIYMGEFFPSSVRTTVICYVGVFWTFSWVVMPCVSWLIIPHSWSLEWHGMVFNSWRMLMALTSIPSFMAAALHLFFPESPMFLLVQGRHRKAVTTLARIYTCNKKCDSAYYPVKSLKPLIMEQDGESEEVQSGNSPVRSMIRQAQLLFIPSTIKITLLLACLFFSNMYGYYGLGLWLPELFNRMQVQQGLHRNVSMSICYDQISLAVNKTTYCDGTSVDSSVYLHSVLMGLIGLLGNVIAGVLAGRLNRRTLPVVLMAISGLCVVLMYFITNLNLNLVIASVFQLAVGTANIVYNSLVVDMFPPNISGMGVCFSVLAGRLGGLLSNLAFGHLLDFSCTIPLFLCAFVLFAGAIVSVLIPQDPYTETKTPPSTSFQMNKIEVFTIDT